MSATDVMQLQRTLGNRAVQRLLDKRKVGEEETVNQRTDEQSSIESSSSAVKPIVDTHSGSEPPSIASESSQPIPLDTEEHSLLEQMEKEAEEEVEEAPSQRWTAQRSVAQRRAAIDEKASRYLANKQTIQRQRVVQRKQVIQRRMIEDADPPARKNQSSTRAKYIPRPKPKRTVAKGTQKPRDPPAPPKPQEQPKQEESGGWFGWIQSKVEEGKQALVNTGQSVWESGEKAVATGIKAVTSTAEAAMEYGGKALQAGKSLAINAGRAVLDTGRQAVNAAFEKLEAVKEKVVQYGKKALDKGVKFVQKVVNDTKTTVTRIAAKAVEVGKKAVTKVKETAIQAGNMAVKAAGKAVDFTKKAAVQVGQVAEDAVKGAVKGAFLPTDLMMQGEKFLLDYVENSNAPEWVKNTASTTLGIKHGMYLFVKETALDLAQLVNIPKVVSDVISLYQDIKSGKTTLGELAGSVLQSIIEPFVHVATNSVRVLKGEVSYEEAVAFGKNLAEAASYFIGSGAGLGVKAARAGAKILTTAAKAQKRIPERTNRKRMEDLEPVRGNVIDLDEFRRKKVDRKRHNPDETDKESSMEEGRQEFVLAEAVGQQLYPELISKGTPDGIQIRALQGGRDSGNSNGRPVVGHSNGNDRGAGSESGRLQGNSVKDSRIKERKKTSGRDLLVKPEETDEDSKKSTDFEKHVRSAKDISNRAKEGKIKYASNYHGRLGKEKELEILSNPDAVYVAGNNSQNFIFRKGGNVVIVESKGSSKGNTITSYGPDGARGESGSAIFGGKATEPGMPVAHDSILNGTIPTPSGVNMPPAKQILP
ncbi:hypothetical protein [Brevibacillus dissolubilis]|uniref:hypothetical protein n=1 Tax=Brevibacillus dissolubilis TaxID=1844116 RepID=UPI0011169FD4|nr:hypothetical protein [Brevibacillus dissolubilis]